MDQPLSVPGKKKGVPAIVYDLTNWDYRVRHSGYESLDITISNKEEEIADVSLSGEAINVYRKRELAEDKEAELQLFIDDLLWKDEFHAFAHLSTIQSEYRDSEELETMIRERYNDDLLYIHLNQESFMGVLEHLSVRRDGNGETLILRFIPTDNNAERLEITVSLLPVVKGVATAHAVRIEGKDGKMLEIARHVQHEG